MVNIIVDNGISWVIMKNNCDKNRYVIKPMPSAPHLPTMKGGYESSQRYGLWQWVYHITAMLPWD